MAKLPDLSHLATSGARIVVRATPKASANRIVIGADVIKVYVTTVPEDGKANAAITKLLAKSLGIAKSQLTLVQGAQSRDKVFEVYSD